VMSVLARGQITPRFDPVVQAGGAGAGPVAHERGAADVVFILGVVVAGLGALGLLLLALGEAFLPLVWCLVLIVAGVLLCLVGRSTGPRRRL
jgi:hypothetical protein